MKYFKLSIICCWLITCCLVSVWAEDTLAQSNDFSGYDAVILEATGRFDHVYTVELTMETVSYKIKFLTPKGIEDFGSDTVIYNPANENIGTVEGSVTLPGGKVTKITKADIFKKDILKKGRKRTELKIAFPALEPGAVVDYSYTRSFEGRRFISNWSFQSELFTVQSEVTFIPWPGSPCGYSMRNTIVEPEVTVTKPGGNKATTVKRINIPPLSKENYSMAYDGLIESIDFYYVDSDSGHQDYWTKGVDRIFKHDLKSLMKPCSESRNIISKEFQSRSLNNEEMIYALYDYVINNHISLSMLSKKEQQEVDKSYRKKLLKADKISEMFQFKYVTDWQTNYILASLIKSAIPTAEVDLVLCLPWDEGRYDSYLKSLRQFTERMLRVKCDGKTYWLAPGTRFMPPGMMDWAVKGIHFLSMNEEGCTTEKIPLDKDSDNTSSITTQVSFDIDNGMAILKRQTTYNRYESYDLRCALMYFTEQEQKDLLEKEIKDTYGDEAELVSFSLTNLDNLFEPLIIDQEYRFPYEFEEVGDQIMMDFPGFERPKTNPFLADTRNGPVCFKYPYKSVQEVTYTLPSGYSIKSYPQNVRINENVLVYKVNYEKISGNQLRLKNETTLQGNMLKKEAAEFFRQTYNDILESGRKKLVLSGE